MNEQNIENKWRPVIPLRQLVTLPSTTIVLDIGRSISKIALHVAEETDGYVLLFTQREADIEMPTVDDLYPVGVIAKVIKVEKNPNINGYKINVEIMKRVKLLKLKVREDYIAGQYEDVIDTYSCEAAQGFIPTLEKKITSELNKYNRMTKKLNVNQLSMVHNEKNLAVKVDILAHFLMTHFNDRYDVLNNENIDQRAEKILTYLVKENELIQLEYEINQRVKSAIDKSQKEYYLREKIKAIRTELGENEDRDAELDELAEKIESTDMPDSVKERARKELKRMRNSMPMSPEYGNTQNYLEFLVNLPWNVYKENKHDLKFAQKILEEDHYGLEKIKSRILEFLAVQFLKNDTAGSILCLVGPPGIGKTSLAKSIARALNRDFVRVALGGVQDVAEIRGHRRTYVGAIPGRIIQSISDIGSSNPVFLLDEIDKLNRDFKGDPSAALLEALDPEQNNSFSDHYLEVPYDLSKVFFITTANDIGAIPGPLRDRMEIIEMTSYTEFEKVQIAKKYLVKKTLDANGLKKQDLSFTEGAIKEIIAHYTREAGVRELQRKIESVCRKYAKSQFLQENEMPARVTKANIKEYLGNTLVDHLVTEAQDQIGVAVGLAWTPVGGEILQIESLSMPGKGNLILTGQLGEVMRESAQISLSYLRSVSEKFNIPKDFTELNDIHIHVPSGAVPKEGPSAGVTLTTSLLSMMIHKPLRQDVAMTGEITLRGKVLAVGGIREKVTAAHRAGSRIIIIPKDCKNDLEDIPKEILDDLEIHLVDFIEDVWKIAFREEVIK